MTDDDRLEAFSRRLDDDWLRQRLASTAPDDPTPEALFHALAGADPLGPKASWWETLGLVLTSWPARVALAGAAVALVVLGFALGRLSDSPVIATLPIPAYDPARVAAPRVLGATATIETPSFEKFREAMRYHGAPEFVTRATPLLDDAVRLDQANDQAQFWLGVALLQGDQPAKAVPPLETAARLVPSSRDYRLYLLFAYLRTKAYSKAGQVLVTLM
jgi:hypothetical protein